MRYFILAIFIAAIAFLGYCLNDKGMLYRKYPDSKTSTEVQKEIGPERINQTGVHGEQINDWIKMVTEMEGVIEDVKKTMHEDINKSD